MRSQWAWATRFGLSNDIDEVLPAIRPLHPTLDGVAKLGEDPVRRSRARLLFELLAAAITGRWRRFEIADHSMRPALEDGEWVLGATRSALRVGDVVVCDRPGRPGFAIVKRIVSVDPTDGSLWLLGDDPGAGSVDSRTFGSIPATAVTARLILRYRPHPPRLIR